MPSKEYTQCTFTHLQETHVTKAKQEAIKKVPNNYINVSLDVFYDGVCILKAVRGKNKK